MQGQQREMIGQAKPVDSGGIVFVTKCKSLLLLAGEPASLRSSGNAEFLFV
jgi:hypothetical protein